MWNLEVLERETIVFKKLHAFKIYKESGITDIERLFPSFKEFVLENKDRSFQDVEFELMKQLDTK